MRLRSGLPRLGLLALIFLQIYTHLAVFSISARSGQLAIPYMMNHGRTLFGDLLEQHAPATSVIGAIAQRLVPLEPLAVTRGLHIVLITALTVLVYIIASQLSSRGEIAGVIAAAIWFWWLPVYGNVLFYFDTVLGFFVCLGLAILLSGKNGERARLRYLLSGLCFGAATLAKQHAWAAALFALLWVWLYYPRGRAAFAIGLLALPLLTIVVVAANGTLSNYIYWNWTFNLTGVMDGEAPIGDFVRKLALSNVLVPAFVVVALARRSRPWFLVVGIGIAATATLLPRFGIIHATAHLPLSMVMGGVVLAEFVGGRFAWASMISWLRADMSRAVLLGVLAGVAVAWGWTGVAPYFPTGLGRGNVPAYDEFAPLATQLQEVTQPTGSLFILPETDSTPQIHVLTGLLPPGTWVKGWRWYFEAPGMIDKLLAEWRTMPPTFVIIFPDLLQVGEPDILRLVEFVTTNYRNIATVPEIVFHGEALIYQWAGVTSP